MSQIETFLADTQRYDGLFNPPTCRDLEGRYMKILDQGNITTAGKIMSADRYVLAEARLTEVRGLSAWKPSESYETEKLVLVKNPLNNRILNSHADVGIRNVIFFDDATRLVFAGKAVAEEFVTVVRPVLPEYQEVFQGYLRNLAQNIDFSLIPSTIPQELPIGA